MNDFPEMPPKVLHAYQLYLYTHNLTEIAEELGVSRTTLWKWKKEYKWEERARSELKKLQEDAEAYRRDIKEEQRKIIRFLLAKGLQKAKDGELTPSSVNDILNLLKYQLELEGERFNDTNIEIKAVFPLERLLREVEERKEKVEKLKKKEGIEG